ncbi:hypothetical protein I3760_06G000200 [Carya illinoinensis]|nr:hypothetical protein I3760_06G000200 [Carya illinoinensis]
MIPADFTLSTPGANPLSVLPTRCKAGAHVEPFSSGVSGVTAVQGNKIPWSHNIRARSSVISDSDRIGLCMPNASGVISWPSLRLALWTAVQSFIKRASLSR